MDHLYSFINSYNYNFKQLFRKHHYNAVPQVPPLICVCEFLWRRLADCCRLDDWGCHILNPKMHNVHGFLSECSRVGFDSPGWFGDAPPNPTKSDSVGICLLTARGSVPQATSLPITFSAFLQVLCPFANLQHVRWKRGGVTSPLSSYSSIRHLSPISNKWIIAGCVSDPETRCSYWNRWASMPSKYFICASNNPGILDANPRKNRIIHEISTNPESTPLRTCFSWLHLFLSSLRSLLSDKKLHFRGSSWPPRPCNWSYPLHQPREKSSANPSLILAWFFAWFFFASGQRMSKEHRNST